MAADIKSAGECLKAVNILFEELKNAKRSITYHAVLTFLPIFATKFSFFYGTKVARIRVKNRRIRTFKNLTKHIRTVKNDYN